jgi:hypothetical protein
LFPIDMRKLILLCLLWLAPLGVKAATVTLVWDDKLNVDTNGVPTADAWYIHSSTSMSIPLDQWVVMTNLTWVDWHARTNMIGTNYFLTIQMAPSQKFFYVCPSNFWGEASPSNIAGTPAPTTNLTDVKIRKP